MRLFKRRHKRSGEKIQSEVKVAEPVKPVSFLRGIITNPNFNTQLMVMLLTFASDNVKMDRRIDSMTTAVDKIRSISDVINNSMQSLRAAAETPKHIRRLLEQKSNK